MTPDGLFDPAAIFVHDTGYSKTVPNIPEATVNFFVSYRPHRIIAVLTNPWKVSEKISTNWDA